MRADLPSPRVAPRVPLERGQGQTRMGCPAYDRCADLQERAPADAYGRLSSDFQTGYAGSIPVARSAGVTGQGLQVP